MADRVSARITIGGTLSRSLLDEFTQTINDEDARLDWDGEPFSPTQIPTNGPFELMAHEVAWGSFSQLEAFCQQQGLPYVRWAGGCPGSFGPERVVFIGSGDPASYAVSEDDALVYDLETIRFLGSLDAIEASAAEGNFTPGSLTIVDDSPPDMTGARHG